MPFYIQNTETQLVLDIKDGEEGEETQVIMFAYHGGANQLWEYKNGMIYSKLNGLVLDVNQETGNVATFEPHGGPNQLWHFDEDGTIRSETGQVLDVSEGNTEPGTCVIVFPKHGGTNQIFKTVTVDE